MKKKNASHTSLTIKMKKICSKCKILKTYDEYYIRPNGSPYAQCNICKKESSKDWYIKNKNNKEKYNINEKICPNCNILKKKDEYYVFKNNGQMSTYCKICSKDKPDKEKVKIAKEKWRQNNKEHVKEYNREFHHTTRKLNIQYKINQALRSSLHRLLNKNQNTFDYVGCTFEFLKKWFEFFFNKNMSWDNYGIYWEIDHVKPCSAFDLTKEEEQKKCYNWTNLRPLPLQNNRSKRDKIIDSEIFKQKLNVILYNKKCQISRQHVQIAGTS